jgi:hypothetical protein
MDDPGELRRLRRELLWRLDAHPMDTWSCTLTRAVIGIIDVAFEPIPVRPQPGLRLVR